MSLPGDEAAAAPLIVFASGITLMQSPLLGQGWMSATGVLRQLPGTRTLLVVSTLEKDLERERDWVGFASPALGRKAAGRALGGGNYSQS